VAITALVVPLIPTPAIAPFSPQGFVVVFQQLLIGVAFGFALQVVFDALGARRPAAREQHGSVIRVQRRPLRGSSTPALGQLYVILATLTFLALGGHARAHRDARSRSLRITVGMTGLGHEGLWA
jgi:flagellar biosynthetic protein FliR